MFILPFRRPCMTLDGTYKAFMSLALCVILKYLVACKKEAKTQKALSVPDRECETFPIILLVPSTSFHTAGTDVLCPSRL